MKPPTTGPKIAVGHHDGRLLKVIESDSGAYANHTVACEVAVKWYATAAIPPRNSPTSTKRIVVTTPRVDLSQGMRSRRIRACRPITAARSIATVRRRSPRGRLVISTLRQVLEASLGAPDVGTNDAPPASQKRPELGSALARASDDGVTRGAVVDTDDRESSLPQQRLVVREAALASPDEYEHVQIFDRQIELFISGE